MAETQHDAGHDPGHDTGHDPQRGTRHDAGRDTGHETGRIAEAAGALRRALGGLEPSVYGAADAAALAEVLSRPNLRLLGARLPILSWKDWPFGVM